MNIFIKLLLLFTIVPIVELALLIELGSYIGVWPTIFIVLLTGVVGASLARNQGFIVVNKIKDKLAKGMIPTDDMIGGLLILLGGATLLTPGILTDITGFLLIIPTTRHMFVKLAKKIFKKYIDSGSINMYNSFSFDSKKEQNKDYVDIEFEKEIDKNKDNE